MSISSFAANKLQVIGPDRTVTVTVKDLKSKLRIHTVKIDDPVYKKEKEFEGFDLSEVFALAGADGKADEIVFTAIDGYAPNMPASTLQAHKGYLVFQEKGGKPFGKVAQGKAMVSPGPFYVVWEEGRKLEHVVPWPYQLAKIEAVDFAKKYPKVFPRDANANEMKGFGLFKAQCMKCHSVNLEGGDIGPELNIPRNVTEYWDKKTLAEFIHKPSSFRARSKMPDFENLSKDDVQNVVAYLKKMSGQKTQ